LAGGSGDRLVGRAGDLDAADAGPNAVLALGPEAVPRPGVAVALGVDILQIHAGVAQGGVARDDIAVRGIIVDRDACLVVAAGIVRDVIVAAANVDADVAAGNGVARDSIAVG